MDPQLVLKKKYLDERINGTTSAASFGGFASGVESSSQHLKPTSSSSVPSYSAAAGAHTNVPSYAVANARTSVPSYAAAAEAHALASRSVTSITGPFAGHNKAVPSVPRLSGQTWYNQTASRAVNQVSEKHLWQS
jgi:hypothetical protein